MAQLPLIGTPLAKAAAPFAEETPGTPLDTAAFLADLVDLRGGVALAEALAGDALELPTEDVPPGELRARLHAGLEHTEMRLADAFDHAFRPRYRLPTAERAWTALDAAGALEKRRGKPLKTAARTLWATYGDFLETHLKRARFALRDLRVELAPALRGIGPDAARLERLDAAFTEATHGELEKLVRRVGPGCERVFAETIAELVAALPEEPTVEHLTPAFAEGGAVRAWMGRCRVLVEAVVDRERRQLEALVESCCATRSAIERPDD